jgi:hypothetical protein
MSQYANFLDQLFDHGRITFLGPNEPSENELKMGLDFVTSFEASYRLELPATPPTFSPESFQWAALNVYRAAQLVVYRDVPAADVETALSAPFEHTRNASADYSVDLIFRFLPDLRGFARSSSTHDPVCQWIDQWCQQWPLSSVGIDFSQTDTDQDVTPVVFDLSIIPDDECLTQLYVDRILERQDQLRVDAPFVQAQIRRTVGIYPELANQLRPPTLQTSSNDLSNSDD